MHSSTPLYVVWMFNESWVEDGKCPICCVFNGWILELSSLQRWCQDEADSIHLLDTAGRNIVFLTHIVIISPYTLTAASTSLVWMVCGITAAVKSVRIVHARNTWIWASNSRVIVVLLFDFPIFATSALLPFRYNFCF